MNILDTQTFKNIMHFKFFMVIAIWGLIPLFIPETLLPYLQLDLTPLQITLMRVWGVIVLLDFFLYLYIYKWPHTELSRYLLLFGVLDNAGIGVVLIIFSFIFKFPWSIWINIPFQLFFGYWFWKFYKEGYKDIVS